MAQIHIDEAFPKRKMYPMILNFQNGDPTDQFTTQDCMLFENKTNQTRTVAIEIDKLIYAGEEKKEDLRKTFILARNKITGKVRIIETCVADMKPVLKNKAVSDALDTSRLELSRKFGSKKQKKHMEQKEKLKINVETVTEQMQKISQDVSQDVLDLTSYEDINSDDFYIPKICRTAKTVQEVYDIDSILTDLEYTKILSEIEGKDYKSDMVEIVKNIVTSKKLSPKQTVLALYASCLLQMYSTIMKKVSLKSFVICQHSITLNEIVLRDFCSMSNGKRTRPMQYKDKSFCHALVFLLLINNYKIELDTICKVLKLVPSTASIKIRVTGACIVTIDKTKYVQLKLPLNTKPVQRRKSAKF